MATNNPTDMPNLTVDGALLIGNTAGRPSAATLTAGSFTKVTNAAGAITVDISDNASMTAVSAWNGSILETAAVSAASDGATITFSVEKSGGGNLTVVFSDGFYAWTTAPDTVALTPGSDTVGTLNYIYLLQSTKTLTASTVGWPATEHAPLATVLCETAATFQTDTAYKFHAWTDHVVKTNNQGHISDINFWIRQQAATWKSGVGQTFTITPNGGAADNVILTTVAGVVLQLHDHTFPAFAGTPDIYVVNDSVTPYTKITDLNALLTDSAGVSMSGKYFSLVVWGVVSEATGDCKLYVNLPGGSYNNANSVSADNSKFANFTIPADFVGTGFLIAQWNLRHQAAASGTWTSIDEIDLRGLLPAITAGGSTASTSEFIDTAFRILDDGDNTKEIAFQASGISTATTRTITMADADISLVANTGTYAAAAGGTQVVTLGTIATGTWNGTDIAVPDGGTGRGTATAYAVLCGGTTATAAHQSIASVGTAAQVLTSNGASALPTFQTPAGGGGSWVFLASATASASATIVFDSGEISATYDHYVLVWRHGIPASDNQDLKLRVSNDGGTGYENTNYTADTINGGVGGSTWVTSGTVTTEFTISPDNGTNATETTVGEIHLMDFNNATYYSTVYGQTRHWNANMRAGIIRGQYQVTETINAIQILYASGNIEAGEFILYGVSES